MPESHSDMTESMSKVMSLSGDVDELQSYYDRWAATYDDDVASHGYGLPSMMVRSVESALTALDPDAEFLDRSMRVIDAGCGTGLVGAALADAGFTNIHGVDLSHKMVEHARRRGVYQSLAAGVDLSEECPENLQRSADVVTVGGVFTVGHVPPTAINAMASIARNGGVLVVSARRAYVEESNFNDVVEDLVTSGALKPLFTAVDAPYTMDSNGDYRAFEVASSS